MLHDLLDSHVVLISLGMTILLLMFYTEFIFAVADKKKKPRIGISKWLWLIGILTQILDFLDKFKNVFFVFFFVIITSFFLSPRMVNVPTVMRPLPNFQERFPTTTTSIPAKPNTLLKMGTRAEKIEQDLKEVEPRVRGYNARHKDDYNNSTQATGQPNP